MGFQAEGVGGSERGSDQGEEISLEIQRFRYKNLESGLFIAEGFIERQGKRGPLVTIKGTSPGFVSNDPIGTTVICRGSWGTDPNYGSQFDVLYVKDAIPTTASALQKYLGSGRLKGIGPATAAEMISRWGVDVLRILDEAPEMLGEISGLTPPKIAFIKKEWEQKKAFYGLVSFLGSHGIGESKALKIQEEMGGEHLERRIRENPYILTEVEGIGFKTADQVALSLGFALGSEVRVNAALQHILNERIQKDGHTAVPAHEWVNQASLDLGRPRAEIQTFCQKLINEQKVLLRHLKVSQKEKGRTGDEWVIVDVACVSPIRMAALENSVAKNIKRLSSVPVYADAHDRAVALQTIEDPVRNLDTSQKNAAWSALVSPLSIITGGPGTGKTTTLRTIVDILKRQNKKVILAAPTGRAAKRMAEAIGEEAMTMHRCLGFKPGEGFTYNAQNRMKGAVFIVDESSMVDTQMAAAWLSALPDGAQMIWVGDADQLPSVGPGDVLRTLIESKAVPVARLTTVHRQVEGSGIAWNAKRVLEGRPPSFEGNPWTDDFSFMKAETNAEIQGHLLGIIDGFLEKGFKPQDIQILTPQRTGDIGVEALNEILRWRLNPEKPTPLPPDEAPRFLVGERVLQTKNNYTLEVFNGDLGTVKEIFPDKSMDVEMEDGRVVKYPHGSVKNLTLGYALTVHKSQGGERPVVIMICSSSHTFMLNRNLVYTGITRGKNKVVMIGQPKTALLAARKKDELVRTTGLIHEIRRVEAQTVAPPPSRPSP